MRAKLLKRDFFERPTLVIARGLIGKYLVRRINGRTMSLMITEVEAYDGFDDEASHASRGQTIRNTPMFGEAGTIYVYFTYGMHWMLNIVCGKEKYPAAVLIRGVEGINGPARLTKALKINKELNNGLLSKRSGLWIEDRGITFSKHDIQKASLIGVDYAGQWVHK